MHTREEADVLAHCGPGTPMGDVFRRYWLPALLSSEIPEPDSPPVRVLLLSENLVAFRDTEGKIGLLAENCPHRGTSLYFGRNEDCGLRCPYHGWKYDTTGQCVEQPSERRSFADSIRVDSYPTHESGGIIWTYLGPQETMTPFRDFGTETLPAEQVVATKELHDCNWLQSFDGDLDAVHTSWLHSYFAMADIPDDGTDVAGSYPSHLMTHRCWWHDRHPILELEEAWFGFRYASLRDTPNGNIHARTYCYVMPSTSILAGVPLNTRQIMIIPRDDTSNYRYTFETQVIHNPHSYGGESERLWSEYPYTRTRPGTDGSGPVVEHPGELNDDYGMDRDRQKTESFTGIPDFRGHDRMATTSMGRLYDRTKEHWGTTDIALIRMHSLLLQAADEVARGGRPPAVGDLDYRSIRAAEKILAAGEDWRPLGTEVDLAVQEEKAIGSNR
jgi:phthalate 4,5-dioxygenase